MLKTKRVREKVNHDFYPNRFLQHCVLRATKELYVNNKQPQYLRNTRDFPEKKDQNCVNRFIDHLLMYNTCITCQLNILGIMTKKSTKT